MTWRNWVPRIFRGGDAALETETPETTPMTDLVTGETLNPGDLIDTRELTSALPSLAASFDPANERESADDVIGDLATRVATAESKYQIVARGALDAAKADENLEPHVTRAKAAVATAGDNFKRVIRAIVDKRASLLVAAREKLDGLRRREREMKIGLSGDPNQDIAKPDILVDTLVLVAVAGGVLALEFFLNFSLVRFAADSATSAGFSIGLAVVAAFAAHVAAVVKKTRDSYHDHLERFDRLFGDKDYKDNGVPVHVFPPRRYSRLLSALMHTIFIGVCLSVLGIRIGIVIAEPDRSIGDLAGTVVFVFLVAGYYGWKLHTASPYQGDYLREYFRVSDQLDRLAEERAELGDVHSVPEIQAATALYHDAVTNARRGLEAAIARARTSRDRLGKLVEQVRQARTWFRDLFVDSLRALINQAALRHPGAHRMPSLVVENDRAVEVNKMFADRRPDKIDLAPFAGGEVSPVAIEEIKADDTREIVESAWKQAVKEHEDLAEADRLKARPSQEPPSLPTARVRLPKETE